jgi:phosphoenolpyruvate carboxykinase (ATP)
LGLNIGSVYWHTFTPALYEEAIRRYEGMVSHLGPLVIRTGQYTGRLPKDKILVPEPSSEQKIWQRLYNRDIFRRYVWREHLGRVELGCRKIGP